MGGFLSKQYHIEQVYIFSLIIAFLSSMPTIQSSIPNIKWPSIVKIVFFFLFTIVMSLYSSELTLFHFFFMGNPFFPIFMPSRPFIGISLPGSNIVGDISVGTENLPRNVTQVEFGTNTEKKGTNCWRCHKSSSEWRTVHRKQLILSELSIFKSKDQIL